MADLSITAANVVPDATATLVDGTFGATFTAGQTGYLDSTTNTWKLADANASSTLGNLDGVSMNGGASGQPGKFLTDGDYTCGGTSVVGTVYVLSATPGGIAPVADLASGWYTNILGVGISATKIRVKRLKSGVAVP